MRRCQDCGDPFDGERWQKLCWTCWRASKDREAGEAEYQRGYHKGYAHGLIDGQRDHPALDRDLISRAVRLTHPDRHPRERAAEANAITAALLELRAEIAA
jgi:hypothetical protein